MSAPENSKPSLRIPPWLRVKLPCNHTFSDTRALVEGLDLHTVCHSAKCPNMFECFSRKTATFLILGNTCTRNCAFCNIGGGIILNGRVYMGSHSAAGEVSNLVTELGSMEGDDFRFEVIGKVAESPVWAGKASASGLIAAYAAEKQLPAHAPQPTGEEIFAAYAAGEPEACRALKKFARRVALGIIGLQSVLDVERVAIGGGISAAGETLREAILKSVPNAYDFTPETIRAALRFASRGNDAGMAGAAALARMNLKP